MGAGRGGGRLAWPAFSASLPGWLEASCRQTALGEIAWAPAGRGGAACRLPCLAIRKPALTLFVPPSRPALPAPCPAAAGHTFATRMTNVFVIGKGDEPMISLPKGKGIRQSILQEQAKIYGKTA